MDAALIVPIGEGVPLSNIGEGHGSVHMVDALCEVISARFEIILGIHFDPAQSINDVFKAGEVDPEVVVDINVVELGQGVLADINAINTGVGEFVGEIALIGNGQRHIVVTRSGKQKYLTGVGVDGGNDIHVAAARG